MTSRRPTRSASGALAILAASAVMGSCTNPVHDAEVNALGPEINGVPQGEYHRAGQPCAVCHSNDGPAKTTFTMAGTIFYGPNTNIGVAQTNVVMVDALGTSYTANTNCVGNFYVTPAEWNPAFPVKVELIGLGNTRGMVSHIGREASCSNCHKDPTYFDSPGHIHLTSSDTGYTTPPCPVNPELTPVGGHL